MRTGRCVRRSTRRRGGNEGVGNPGRGDETEIKRIKHVPAYLGNLIGVGHGGTYWQPNGGKAAAAVVAWLDWQLRGDKNAAKTFTGGDCGLCRDPAWQFTASSRAD